MILKNWVWLRVIFYVIFSRFSFTHWRVRFWCFMVWLWVLWYVLFSQFSFTCWRVRFRCFGLWHFCTNRSWFQRWLTPFNIFALKLKFVIFPPNVKICFIVFFSIIWFCAHSIYNRYDLSYSMILRTPMGDIRRPSEYGSRDPDTGAFIQWVDGGEPTSHKLWYQGIGGICHKVHTIEHIYIPSGTVRDFITAYLSGNGRNNWVIW